MIAAFLAIASVWFASPCQPMRRVVSSAVFPLFHTTAPTFKVSRIAAEVSAASHSQFCVRRNTSSFRGSDFGEAERYNLSAYHDCTAFSCFGAQPVRAQIHNAPLFGINHLPTVRATPLHIPRRTCCHDECGATEAGLSGRAVRLCSLRLVPICLFRSGGVSRGLFFLSQR